MLGHVRFHSHVQINCHLIICCCS